MTTLRGLCLLLSFLTSFLTYASTVVVPEPLKPWQEWVLYGFEDKLCPTPFNNPEAHFCVWPSDLQLTIDTQQGKFTQKAVNYVQGWIPLPGDENTWPQEVKINGKAIAVLSHQGFPAVYLDKGEYVIQGQFVWNTMPDFLQLPQNLGTLTLTMQGKQIDQPIRNQDARLWFRQQDSAQKQTEQTDTLSITAFRLFQEGIPLTCTTVLRLKATGQIREVSIGPVLLKNSLPMNLQSPLPARIEENGLLRIQLKPGIWEIAINSRFLGKQEALAFEKADSVWPTNEVWSFQPQNELHLIEIEGGKAIDPQQTDMPQAWKSYPSYLLEQGNSLNLVEKRRGQEKHPSDLALDRKLWLNFAGNGFISLDTISGKVNDNWRLITTAPFALKRATVDGQDKLITQVSANEPPGIEIRQGRIDLSAVNTVESKPFRLPAIGWDFDVRSLSTTLFLPPGWKLVGAWGADTVTHAWIQEWTLLDLFLVLIMAAAIAKLIGFGMEIVALVMMVLTYQEAGAPIYSWLNLIAALALYKVLPQSGFRKLFLYYSRVSFVILIVIALPFMVKQIREAIYPQLTVPNQSAIAYGNMAGRAQTQEMMALPHSPQAAVSSMGEMAGKSRAMMQSKMLDQAGGGSAAMSVAQEPPLEEYDANAKIQTGPGIPTWRWDVSQLIWNGPVLKDQKITLWILPSMVTSVLKFLQIGLMFLLIYGLTRVWGIKPNDITAKLANISIISLSALLMSGMLLMPQQALADMPDKTLLEDLRARLIKAPECQPECAEISRMQIEANANQLTIRSTVQTAASVALPLPSSLGKWMPRTVLVDGVAAKEMQMDSGLLWLQLMPGVHEVVMEGPIGSQDKFEIFVPLKPKWISATANGWGIEGIFRNQLQAENFYLNRQSEVKQEETVSTIQPGRIPSFVQVTRTLKLGFEWEVLYEVKRIAPQTGGIRIEIPLLANESVLSELVEVKDKKAIVSLGENQYNVTWRSKLNITPEIVLAAVNNPSIKEEWQLEAISQWHCDFEGLPIIHQQDPQGRWSPTWYPWPGESLKIHIIKPQAVVGNTLTIDNSRLTVTPGNRATNNLLLFNARSSLGGTHLIKIPANATLQDVLIDGLSQPINAKEGEISIPLHPGNQAISVKWQLPQGIKSYFTTPKVNLEIPSSNALTELKLSKDRWILFLGGPAIGPAVLIWGVLLVVLGVSIGLGRIKALPLNIWQWFLLGIGLCVATPLAILFVVIWFFAMHKRKQLSKEHSDTAFNVIQVGLGILTLLFVVSLFTSISNGLLGTPKMQLGAPIIDTVQPLYIGSSTYDLAWYQDMTANELPYSWVVSLPLYVYRILMLLWALWLAFSLIKWMQWGWQCISTEGLWRKSQTMTVQK